MRTIAILSNFTFNLAVAYLTYLGVRNHRLSKLAFSIIPITLILTAYTGYKIDAYITEETKHNNLLMERKIDNIASETHNNQNEMKSDIQTIKYTNEEMKQNARLAAANIFSLLSDRYHNLRIPPEFRTDLEAQRFIEEYDKETVRQYYKYSQQVILIANAFSDIKYSEEELKYLSDPKIPSDLFAVGKMLVKMSGMPLSQTEENTISRIGTDLHKYDKYKRSQVVNAELNGSSASYTLRINPTIAQSPMTVKTGGTFTQWGTGFTPNSTATIHYLKPDGTEVGLGKGGFGWPNPPLPPKQIEADGSFSMVYRTEGLSGSHTWYAVDSSTGSKSNTITFTVAP